MFTFKINLTKKSFQAKYEITCAQHNIPATDVSEKGPRIAKMYKTIRKGSLKDDSSFHWKMINLFGKENKKEKRRPYTQIYN